MVNFLRMHIPDYARLTHSLYDLLRKEVRFSFSMDHKKAFDNIKKVIIPGNPLVFFDPSKEHSVFCDASHYGIGAVVLQEGKPVMFIAKKFSDSQLNWTVIEKEAFAIYFALKKIEYLVS
ncbi:uncharacterized protein K02A2.6-like, partial [Aduncisulcus paluster]